MSARDNLGSQWPDNTDKKYGVTVYPHRNDSYFWTGGTRSTSAQLHHPEAAMQGFVDHDLKSGFFEPGGDAHMVRVGSDGVEKTVRIQGKSGKEGRAQRAADYNRDRYGI